MSGRGHQIDRYRILGSWAGRDQETFWVAHDAEDPDPEVLYAVRPIATPDHSPADRRSLIAEARAAAQILHRDIARIHDVVEAPDDRMVYLVSEFVQGESLRELLRAAGGLPRMVSVSVAARIARVLDRVQTVASGEERRVHGGLSTANIMFTHDGGLKILDYGLVSELARQTGGAPSAAYAAPECLALGVPVQDPRSDVYALGRILAEMVASAPPRPTPSRVGPKGSGSSPRARSGAQLDQIIERATASKPSDRYRDAGELSRSLDAYVKSRAPGMDVDAELGRLMLRFQHKARATRTLITRWTAQAGAGRSLAKTPVSVVVAEGLVDQAPAGQAPALEASALQAPAFQASALQGPPHPRELALAELAAVARDLPAASATDDILASRTEPGRLRQKPHLPVWLVVLAVMLMLLAAGGFVFLAIEAVS